MMAQFTEASSGLNVLIQRKIYILFTLAIYLHVHVDDLAQNCNGDTAVLH